MEMWKKIAIVSTGVGAIALFIWWLSQSQNGNGCVPGTEEVLTRCSDGRPKDVRVCNVDGETWTDFTYTCPVGDRIYFNYFPEVKTGDSTLFRMPVDGYTTKTLKEEIITLNGGINPSINLVSSVNLWMPEEQMWASYALAGRDVPINIGDIVRVVVRTSGLYWEY